MSDFSRSFKEIEKHCDLGLLKEVAPREIMRFRAAPGWFSSNGERTLTLLSASSNTEELIDFYQFRFETKKIELVPVTLFDLFCFVEKYCKADILDIALNDLRNFSPSFSASFVFSKSQVRAMGLCMVLAISWVYFDISSFLLASYALIQCIYLAAIGFRFVLSLAGSRNEMKEAISNDQVGQLKDEELPVYTILIPLFKEPEVVPLLLDALRKLDYPDEKLDILLLLEECDQKTMLAALKANPPDNWRLLVVPDSLPRTKPKACNYGLQFARGEYLTIYDGEDLPEPEQLKKALIAHRKSGPQCLCVQAALNYFNANENVITKLFTLEYSYWFDYLLPGLDYFHLPIPLGGTSNHFHVGHLRDLGGWDPFNTTEDADLGLRAFCLGYRVGVIDSTTYEEANSRYWNFIRQRSRWLKGYMQTALVYNRFPLRLLRQLGWKNWLSFQLLITCTPLMLLINPIVWLVFFVWASGVFEGWMASLPLALVYVGLFNLFISNFIGVYLNMLGVFKRQQFSLIPYAFLNPFYWLFFHSVAAYKALWQLFVNPFFWEKTDHGISHVKPVV